MLAQGRICRSLCELARLARPISTRVHNKSLILSATERPTPDRTREGASAAYLNGFPCLCRFCAGGGP